MVKRPPRLKPRVDIGAQGLDFSIRSMPDGPQRDGGEACGLVSTSIADSRITSALSGAGIGADAVGSATTAGDWAQLTNVLGRLSGRMTFTTTRESRQERLQAAQAQWLV